MTITKLIKSNHVAGRWYAVLSDGARLQINLDMIAEYGLYTGRELTENEERELREKAEKTGVKARALNALSARSMSSREMFDKLVQKGADEHTAAETVAWLEDLGYLNDREYAEMVVRHYASKGYGTRRVRDELHRRGIDRELADEALEHMPDTDGAIDALLEKKLRGGTPDKKELKKVTDMLLRRGFSWNEIGAALRRRETEAEEE